MQKNFVSYNSSAGTGKTFTLVKEYLKIALATDNTFQYRNILAVTFTNKAAAEMKERVLDALKAIAGITKLEGTPQFVLAELVKPIEQEGLGVSEEVLKDRSYKVLKSILHNYNDFAISTIDKFTHKIIRTFAHDLQLPLNFNIELGEKEVLKSAIDMLVAQVGNNDKLTKILVEYAIQKSDDEKSWNIERDLLSFAEKLLKDGNEFHLENIRDLTISDFEDIKKYINKGIKQFETKVKELGEGALKFIDNKGIERNTFSHSDYPNYWSKVMNLEDFSVGKRLASVFEDDKDLFSKSKPQTQKDLIEENKQELLDLFSGFQDFLKDELSQYIINKEVLKNLYNIAVLNEIEKTINEFKTDNNILNLSDFNKRIAAIVASEPAPFIYERLGEKYQHYLIDEFQDTSITQWHNMLPLVDNSLANGKFNMIVGDAKQAIYRWRGGEVEQIIAFPKVYGHNNNPLLLEREQSIDRNFDQKELATNYRSKAEIVDFTNQFFQSVAPELPEKYNKLYNELNQGFEKLNIGGGIEVLGFEGINDKDSEQVEDYKEKTIGYVLEKVKECLKDEYSLKDIAILCRGNKDAVEISEFLLNEGVNVVSSESLLLGNSNEVVFVIDLLRYLTNPGDTNYQIKVMRYLTQYVYKEALFEQYQQKGLLGYLNAKNIDFNFNKIANYSLYELAEELITVFNLNKDVNLYVQFFLDKVHEYASRNDNSVLNFLDWWDLKSEKFSVVIPDGVEAVQVMTIHKSKGLEFPVVIYPFADSAVKRGEDYFWTNKINIEGLKSAVMPIKEQLSNTIFSGVFEEEMNKAKLDLVNLVYVAFTRPKDRLYIITKKGKSKSKNGSVGDYLNNYCSSNPDNKIGDFHYKFGLFNKNVSEVKNDSDSLTITNVVYNNWRDKIKISYQAPLVWDVENPETIGEHGTLIHNILAKINVPTDLDGVLASYQLKGLLGIEEVPEIKQKIEDLFTNSTIKGWFENFDELKNERSILLQNGESYQPDRVLVKNDQTIVIDYKTGEQEEKHKEQITNYRNLLSQMGYQNISAQLLYVNDGSLVEV
ncbi:MAG: UvrD-helicase domain-containing protein [Vicingaceae bacterium]|nr:UvrD-helicase domain-containing protein [Vicingaceae bacterium]